MGMYEHLLDELAENGLTWAFGEVGQAGLESQEWMKSEETCRWILDMAEEMITGYNPHNPDSYPCADPKALILMSQACLSMLQNTAGLFSKDLAMIAYQNNSESGQIGFAVEFLARGIIANGRYIDCLEYFHTQYQESSYDESFLPDVVEVLDDLNKWFEAISRDDFDWPSEEVRGECIGRTILQLVKIIRGAFMQLEMSLWLMSGDQITQFTKELGPRAATINLNYSSLGIMESNLHYTQCHTSMAYIAFMFSNLGGPQIPIDSVLDSVYKACLDDADLHPEERYYTLFAQVLRLRILSGNDINDERWEHAVEMARRALNQSEKINAIDTYSELINNLVHHGRIVNLELYAKNLGRIF